MPSHHPYEALTPDVMLDAVESFGLRCDGHFLALNSYENRVYQIGIEEQPAVVAKFYRPGRWSDEAILEEHSFTRMLADREIPVVAPLADPAGSTLFHHQGFRFALYPRQGGRRPALEDPDELTRLGRFLGRIHALGATGCFVHRPTLTIDGYGEQAREFLLQSGLIPEDLAPNYATASEQVLRQLRSGFTAAGPQAIIRLHGDFHPGNLLWTDNGPHLVDFDDCRMGPAMQDLWMMLSGDRRDMTAQLSDLLEGYADFYDFDPRQLHLIEPLRALRMIHYAAWLARRWADPAFPLAFPWFNTPRYWEDQIETLREQSERLEEPPLKLG